MKSQSSIAYPTTVRLVTRGGFQVALILVTLSLTLYYNLAYYWYTPLTGVDWDYVDNTSTAIQLVSVVPGSPGGMAGLRAGDRLLSIDGRAVASANRPFYTPKRAGESVHYTIERAGQRLTFDVVAGDYWQHPEYLLAMLPFGLLSLLVYALGLLLCLLSAPQDQRARLVGTVWLLAGLAVAASGPGYFNGSWFAVDVYLSTFAVGGYLSLAAYLYFPAAAFSNRVRLTLLRAHLGLTLLALAAYAWQRMLVGDAALPEALVSANTIRYIFILTWLVNLGLLLKNRFAAHEPETKRQTQIILLGTLLGVLPVLLLTSLPNLLLGPQFVILPGNLTVLALVFIPVSYGYVIGQHRLLKIDLLVNRALAWFIVVTLTLLAVAATVGLLAWLRGSQQTLLLGGVLAAVLVAGLRPNIQVWVDRVLYGTSYDFHSVTTHLSEHLSNISERCDLDGVLIEFVQQMHIQKSELLLAWDGRLELGPDQTCDVSDDGICRFLLNCAFPVRALSVWAVADPETTRCWAAYDWARVFAPILHRGTLHGVLALGDRLTGDYYSEQDMQNINTVGQLVGLTAANLATVASLRGLAQRLVQNDEEQRRSLARDLHDDVLQDVAMIQSELTKLNPRLAQRQKKLAVKLRQMIKAQHPAILDHDIGLALQELVDNMRQRVSQKETTLRFHNLLPEAITLGSERTTALYRIVQESLSNTLKHAQANDALVTLQIDQGDVLAIEIKDDGIGMENPAHEPAGHYGLLGMRERATMIGATLTVISAPEDGTIVLVRLKR